MSSLEDPRYQLYFINRKGKKMCVDAVEDDGSIGRLINHSHCCANTKPVVINNENEVAIFIETTRAIAEGEQLLFNYDDNGKLGRETLASFKCPHCQKLKTTRRLQF